MKVLTMRKIINELNNLIQSFNPCGAVMITTIDLDDKEKVEIFNQNNGNYYNAAAYMLYCLQIWQIPESFDLDEITNFDTIEELIKDCINTKNFGAILGLYIQNEDFNFIKVCDDLS